MNFLSTIFHVVFYQPLFNALVFLYDYVPGKDFGIAIILLTIALRFVLYPLSAKAFYAQKALSALRPKIQEIQEKFKGQKDEISRRLLELYKTERFNPLSAFLPILVQLPILFALYRVFQNGLQTNQLTFLYPFVPPPPHISATFLGILDLGATSLPIALLAGLFQFIQSKQVSAFYPAKRQQGGKPDMSGLMQKQMMYLFPLFTVFIVAKFPAALGLYWITTSLFSIWQQWYLMKKSKIQIQNPSARVGAKTNAF